MDKISKLKELLAQGNKKIGIVSHRNPDGDAIGSSLALYHFLKAEHQVSLLLPSDFPAFLNWMPGSDQFSIYDNEVEKTCKIIDELDILFVLDFNAFDRIDKLGEYIQSNRPSHVVMIDHHIDPQDIADISFSETTSSSTCELLYSILESIDDKKISISCAECIYLGMITDTGGFKYNTTSNTFRVAASLNDRGVDNFRIQDLVFNNSSEKQIRILGLSLNNRMEILPEYHTGIISLNKEDFIKYDIQRGDTEGVVNYILRINGIKLAIFLREQPSGVVKLSFRSRGEFSVHELAREHFKGGGHKNAAGGFSYFPLSRVRKKIRALLPEYQKELENAKIYE